MVLFAVSVAFALIAYGGATAYNTNADDQTASRYNHYVNNAYRSSKAQDPSIYDILAGDTTYARPVQRVNTLYTNPEYNSLSAYNYKAGRSRENAELSLDKLTDAYKQAVKEHIRDIARQNKRIDADDKTIESSEDSDHAAVTSAVEAAVLARQSNDELTKALHAVNIAKSAPEAKKLLRNAAVASAFNSARLAQQSNSKLAAAVRSYNLLARSGSTVRSVQDRANLDVAIDETRSASTENADLVKRLDASLIARDKDADAGVLANALNAAKHAHESNAEIGTAVQALESARSNSDGAAKNEVAVAAAASAARLSQQSKDDLAAAVTVSRRSHHSDNNDD